MTAGPCAILLWLTAAAAQAAADGTGPPHRQIDPARTHAARGASASLGGPKSTASATGLRFPVVPAGSLASHPTSAVRRPAAGGPKPVPGAGAPVARNPALHPAASRPIGSALPRLTGKPSAPASTAPAPAQ